MAEICVSSHHSSIADLLQDSEFRLLVHREGFLVELRLDGYGDLGIAELDQVLDIFSPNVVVTYRHPQEGGKRPDVSDTVRLGFLQHAARRGAAYVDIEARTPRGQFQKHGSKLILSHHDFEGTPPAEQLIRQWESMRSAAGVDVVKIACAPKKIHESAALLKLLVHARDARSRQSTIALGMGEAGFWTRVVGPLFGSPLTFARGTAVSGTAPGQPHWRDLDGLYRFRKIEPGWPVYGVIGNPIAHSLSPLLHNTALRQLNLDGVYLPFKVEGDPIEFVRDFMPLGLRGLSVTIPHKEMVQSLCSEIDPVAASIGAINTLVYRADGSWWGTNTDALAAASSLETAAGSLNEKRVLIIGAGGAARAVAFGIKSLGAKIFIINRSHQRAIALADAVGAKAINLSQLSTFPKMDIIVNTTPLGMFPGIEFTPLDKCNIPQGSIVFDSVYNPRRTRFLRLAEECGSKTLDGTTFFIGQGMQQVKLFTGREPDKESLEKIVLDALR